GVRSGAGHPAMNREASPRVSVPVSYAGANHRTRRRRTMDTLQAVARILKLEGVEWVSCFPSNNLLEAVPVEGIRPILFRHERGAVMAADGFSRLNDRQKFGVVITQGGPGAENSMGGIAQAFADNVPILVFQGGVQTGEYAVRPNFSPVRTYQS